jgi:hypothetical protein
MPPRSIAHSASVNTLALVEYAVVPILPWRVGEFFSGVCLGDALNLFTTMIETPDRPWLHGLAFNLHRLPLRAILCRDDLGDQIGEVEQRQCGGT